MSRLLVLESAIVITAAVVPAWNLTRWGMAQWAALAASRYQVVDYSVTTGTLAYLAVVSAAAGVLLSVAPVARVLQLSAGGALQGEARGATHARGTRRLVTTLVSGQMALAIVLLAGAGVLIRSFTNIVGADTGVRSPESVLVGLVRLPSATYPTSQSRLAFFDRVQLRLQTVAGVERASMSGGLPVKFPGALRQLEVDAQSAAGQGPVALPVTTTTPGYFDVVGASVIAGRDFTADDRETTQAVAIVNQRFAAQRWPGQSPLGRRLRTVDRDGAGPWRVVVGVVSNIMGADPLRQQFKPLVYVPLTQEPPERSAFFLVRTDGQADRIAAEVRTELQTLDSDVTLDYFDTLEGTFAFDRDFMDAEHSELGKYSKAAPVFAVVALLLAATGLVAVVANSVAQRTREIGIRMAIGAAPRDILRMILTEGLRPVGTGLAAGLAASVAVNRVLESQLVGVSPSDPLVMVTAPAILLITALVAFRIPVQRALGVDPAVALRHE
jgi:predicted permease